MLQVVSGDKFKLSLTGRLAGFLFMPKGELHYIGGTASVEATGNRTGS